MNEDIRWKQRFQNFKRAFFLLEEALENGPDSLNQLEKEGVIQRFECCVELAWKTIKDYMESCGAAFATVTPKAILKEAFQAKVIGNGQVWMDMLTHRNLLSHTYDFTKFEDALEAIHRHYIAAFRELYGFLVEEDSL